MIRTLGVLFVTLAIAGGSGRADEVIWRAARGRTAGNPSAQTPATTVAQPATPAADASLKSTDAGPPTPVLPAPTPVEVGPPGSAIFQVDPLPPGAIGQSFAPPADEPWKAPAAGSEHQAARLELTAEYLLWWSKAPNNGPPLLTTSPPNGASGVPGAVPGSTVLLSAGDLGQTFRDGVRFGATYWLDDCDSYGFDGRIFFTGDRTDRFTATSNQFPNLFRPFVAANPGLPRDFSEQVTGLGLTTGSFSAVNKSSFWGAEANYRDNLWCSCDCENRLRVDLLAGFRYLHLDESLSMTEAFTRTVASTAFPDEVAGTRIFINDSFSTHNDFYGGQLGTTVGYSHDRLSVNLRTTVALGTNHERLDINGGQVRAIPGGPTLVLPGGLLALPTNSGEFTRNVFSVVPEVGLNVGYQVTDRWRAFVGYNFLYASNVIRPVDQIDRVIDVNNIPRFVPGPPGTIPSVFPPRPAARFNDTDFWAQGVTFGVEYRW